METTLKTPFSNVQLELLKLFSHNIPEDDLLEIKQYLIQYRAQKLMSWADQIWEEKKWTQKDEQRLLDTHQRTPYKAQNEFLDKQNKTNQQNEYCIVSEDKHFRALKNVGFPKVEVLTIEEFKAVLLVE